MSEIRRQMFLIKKLDGQACLMLSNYTGKWYVSTRIEVANGAFLAGITAHRDTPEEAVSSYLAKLQAIRLPERLVLNAYGEDRKAFVWNHSGSWQHVDEAALTS